jgi:uncharacterized protein YkwD
VALGVLFATSPASSAPGAPDDVALLLSSVNSERSVNHLRPLRLDERLSKLARQHALDMVCRNYFDHSTPEGYSPFARMDAAHYRYGYAGENLAVDRNASEIAHDFLLSQEHRANLLGAHYQRIGIGAVSAAVGEVVVEDFSD